MIANLKPYPEYKESRLSWFGLVPTHWSFRRNGGLFTQRNETGFPDLPILEVSIRSGVKIRDLGDAARKQIIADRRKYKRTLVGDIAYNMMRMWQGAAGRVPVDGLVSPAYVVARPLPQADSRYYELLFRTSGYQSEVNSVSRGIVSDRNRLYWEDFKQLPSPVPPPEEQSAIVRFLEYANGRLERAIRAKRKVIALLHEQKQAIIHRAVTRGLPAEASAQAGLDPTVPLKPSGIPWLGDIPEHWETRRLKYLANFQSGNGITALQIEPQGDYPVYGGNGLRGYTNRYTHDGHFALIGRQGALCGNINYAKGKFFASEHAVVATLRPAQSVLWFGELLKVMNLNQYSQSAAQPGLAVERIKNLAAPVPPAAEQPRIVEAFQEQTSGLTTAITRLEREISLLREYRTRLVADVVTGKLDVRPAARHLPASSTEPEPAVAPEDSTDEAQLEPMNNE